MTKNVSNADTYCRAGRVCRSISIVGLLAASADMAVAQDSAESQNKAVVERFFQTVLNEGDSSMLPDLMAMGYVQHNPFVPPGLAGFEQGLSEFRAAFPDYSSTIQQIAADGDRVWVFHTASGTQCRDYFGVSAAGQRFEIDIVDVFRIEDGLLVEHWDVFPLERMMTQLTDTNVESSLNACPAPK